MQFTAQTKILADALAFVSAAVPKGALMPVTEHARLELVGPKLALISTDLDIERSAILDVTGSVDGLAVVPCRPLAKLLARVSDCSDVKIDAGASKLTVRGGRGYWSLPLLDDAFPVLDPPGQGAAKFRLSRVEALRVARRATHSISDGGDALLPQWRASPSEGSRTVCCLHRQPPAYRNPDCRSSPTETYREQSSRG